MCIQVLLLWGHPHSSSPSSVSFSAFLTTLLPQISDLHHGSPSSVQFLTSRQRSLDASISVSLPKRPFGAPASETTSTGHAHQTCQITNGRPGWTAGVRIKGSHISEPDHSRLTTRGDIHQDKISQTGNITSPIFRGVICLRPPKE
jgi:hypothetical protein